MLKDSNATEITATSIVGDVMANGLHVATAPGFAGQSLLQALLQVCLPLFLSMGKQVCNSLHHLTFRLVQGDGFFLCSSTVGERLEGLVWLPQLLGI